MPIKIFMLEIRMNKNSLALFLLIPAGLLIIAPLLSFPYGFYTLLRLIITITSGLILYNTYKASKTIRKFQSLQYFQNFELLNFQPKCAKCQLFRVDAGIV